MAHILMALNTACLALPALQLHWAEDTSPGTLYFSHAEVTQMLLPRDLCTSCFLCLEHLSFPFTPLQPQFDHHSWGNPMLTFPDQKKSLSPHHEPMLCFIYCTCNSTFIQFLKLVSSSSSFPLPSPYLVLCATQKNVEGVNKQTPSTGTHVPTPKPTLSLSSFRVLRGTRPRGDIRRPEFQLRQCLKSACKVFSHSLPLSPQIHCRRQAVWGYISPSFYSREIWGQGPGAVQGYPVQSEAQPRALLSWSPSKSSYEPFLSWPSVSPLAKWRREVQLDGVNSVTNLRHPRCFHIWVPLLLSLTSIFYVKDLKTNLITFFVLFC